MSPVLIYTLGWREWSKVPESKVNATGEVWTPDLQIRSSRCQAVSHARSLSIRPAFLKMILFGSAFWDISKQNVALVLNFLTFPVDDTTTKVRKHLASLKTLFCRVGYPVMINSKCRCAASEPNGAQYVVFFQRRRKSNHSDGPNKIANWSPKFRSLNKHQFKSISVMASIFESKWFIHRLTYFGGTFRQFSWDTWYRPIFGN